MYSMISCRTLGEM